MLFVAKIIATIIHRKEANYSTANCSGKLFNFAAPKLPNLKIIIKVGVQIILQRNLNLLKINAIDAYCSK